MQNRHDSHEDEQRPLIPLTLGALRYRTTREILLRRVQRGEVVGECRDGRWWVAEPPGQG
jgi:GH24 family phage-related lysozyme (muramidase)